MILLDTNILIYLHGAQLDEKVAEKLGASTLDTCNIIVAEVLGYKHMSTEDSKYFKDLLSAMNNHIFDKEVTNKVIELRLTTQIKLPDAIIAATCLVKDLSLWTHNTKDYKKIPGLVVFDPLA